MSDSSSPHYLAAWDVVMSLAQQQEQQQQRRHAKCRGDSQRSDSSSLSCSSRCFGRKKEPCSNLEWQQQQHQRCLFSLSLSLPSTQGNYLYTYLAGKKLPSLVADVLAEAAALGEATVSSSSSSGESVSDVGRFPLLQLQRYLPLLDIASMVQQQQQQQDQQPQQD
ncbi:hypothetical protein EBH_0063530 [Eimeria brunetti]|uniref:Uncharacterized protein n=1 Tax=Eimeria brunetti TaxID=51314 RepID=U6LV50_9EIME|nr:hypothetical protein EBH_0063530 [Eimeria brunetti]